MASLIRASFSERDRDWARTAASISASFSASVAEELSRMLLMASSLSQRLSLRLSTAVTSLSARSAIWIVLFSTAARSSSIFPSKERVCACMAASMATSLVSRVLLTEVTMSMRLCSFTAWSAAIWLMAAVSLSMASWWLNVPLLMASTTWVKSLVTTTLTV